MLAAVASSIWCNPSDPTPMGRRCASRYELRFSELFNAGRGFVFPCDAEGNVDIDHLTERARVNYFFARTTIGREFSAPVTCPIADCGGE